MGIRRKEEIQSDAIRNLINETQPRQRGSIKGASSLVSQSGAEGDIRVDVGLASLINSELNPETLKAERAAKLAEIKRQVQNGTYRPPSSEALAVKFVQELAFESAEGKNLKERDE